VLDLKASFKLASHGLAIRATTNRNPLISQNNEDDYDDDNNNNNNNNNGKALCMYLPYVVPVD